jgi:hypothetical protein
VRPDQVTSSLARMPTQAREHPTRLLRDGGQAESRRLRAEESAAVPLWTPLTTSRAPLLHVYCTISGSEDARAAFTLVRSILDGWS